jgi:hypothetical protein
MKLYVVLGMIVPSLALTLATTSASGNKQVEARADVYNWRQKQPQA